MSLLIIQLSLLMLFILVLLSIMINVFKSSNKVEELTTENINLEQNLTAEKLKNKVEAESLRLKDEKQQEENRELKEKTQRFETEKKQFEERKERSENTINQKETKLEQERERLENRREALEFQREEMKIKTEMMEMELSNKLIEVANLNEKEAQDKLFEILKERKETEYVSLIKDYKSNLELEKANIAQKILLGAMENVVVDATNNHVTKAIKIPTEEMKGRLIGREGRNIKTIETLLGVNIIIDDTPGVISISTFNPVRKQIATLALNSLISSGKINQVSIEEEVKKSEAKVNEIILEKGKEAVYKFNIQDFDIELIKILGQLHFRTSYGQNVLAHSIEAAEIAQKIASEIKLDPNLAARCLLLHDIGKVDSQATGKSHVELGVLVANNFNESEIVINAIEAHHGDVEPTNVYSLITIIADKMSAGRNGARRDTFDLFVERIETLEKVAMDVKGVSKAYALQGGRELRVIVEAKNVSDNKMELIADEIKRKIEDDLIFPGIIKVNVIREMRHSVEAVKSNILKGE